MNRLGQTGLEVVPVAFDNRVHRSALDVYWKGRVLGLFPKSATSPVWCGAYYCLRVQTCPGSGIWRTQKGH